MSQSLISFLFIASALVGAFPALAYETYKVIGVKAGDSLTMREEPEDGGKPSDWKELGRIPAASNDVLGTGRSKVIGTQRWFEVHFGPTRGWVNGTFLESADPADLRSATFSCAGTEPFWGVTLSPNAGEYSELEEKTQLTTTNVQPATARLFPLFYKMSGTNGRIFRATVSRQSWCSDGMSDYDYAFQVLLTDDEIFHEGCCVLNR